MTVVNIPCSNITLTSFSTPVKLVAFFLILCTGPLWAEDSLDAAVLQLQNNQPESAVEILNALARQGEESQDLYYYLGLAYEALGRHSEALKALTRGMDLGGPRTTVLALNAGNNAYKAQLYSEAEGAYSRGLVIDSSLAGAYLNRGNTRVRMGEYGLAIADYETYLTKRPGTPQRSAILSMIDSLKRRVADNLRAEEERKRLEEEARARQAQLLQDVLNSLETASEDTTNLTTESDELESYEEDWDLAE